MTGIGSIFCLVVIATVLTETTATDYCNPKLCPSETTHTMCKYKSNKPAAACGEVLEVGCTNDDVNVIVMHHNKLRQKVASGEAHPQPPAAFMPDLVWDDELAQIAQRWANQCESELDECSDVDRFDVGQNLAEEESTDGDTKLEDLIQSWFDGVEFFDPEEVSEYIGENSDEMGTYTQLVWAKTTKVGCGCIKYKTDDEWIKTHLICNYGPSGNVEGEPMYKIKT